MRSHNIHAFPADKFIPKEMIHRPPDALNQVSPVQRVQLKRNHRKKSRQYSAKVTREEM